MLCSLFENVNGDVIARQTNYSGNGTLHYEGNASNGVAVLVNGAQGEESDGNNEDDYDSNAEGEVKKCAKGDLGRDDCWIMLKVCNFPTIEEILYSTMKLLSFSLVEPVHLGYFPFQTQNGTYCESERKDDHDDKDDELQWTDNDDSDDDDLEETDGN